MCLKDYMDVLRTPHHDLLHGYMQSMLLVNKGSIRIAENSFADGCCAFASYSRPDFAAFCKDKFEGYADVQITPTAINVRIV